MPFNIDRERFHNSKTKIDRHNIQLSFRTESFLTAEVINQRIAQLIDNLGDDVTVEYSHTNHSTTTFDNIDF